MESFHKQKERKFQIATNKIINIIPFKIWDIADVITS